MKILKIQRNKIQFQNGAEFSLSKAMIKQYKLEEGADVDEKSYKILAETSALSYSYWLLARKDYSKGELRNKLFLKYRDNSLISKIIEKLSEMSYINDYEFAKSYITSHKNWGRKKIEYFLSMKEVDSSVIAELLDNNIDEELEKIEKLWIKMGKKEEHKKIESLMRKGFQYGLIKKFLSQN